MTKPIAVEEYGEWDIEVDGVKYAGKRTLTQAQATAREEVYHQQSECREANLFSHRNRLCLCYNIKNLQTLNNKTDV